MKRTLIAFLANLVLVLVLYSNVFAAPSAKVTARVVDENGSPMQGAEVTVGYTLAKKGGIGTDDRRERGVSDNDGLFTATGETIIPQVTIHANYDGYYRSSKWAQFKSSSSLLNRWEPWNPTIEVVLKKKRNPVPMYQKYLDWLPAPKLNEQVGYDLEVGDWVSPYGKGLISDFVFDVQTTRRAWTDYESSYTLTFSNVNDGIQEYIFDKSNQSSYKWPFEAPEEGRAGGRCYLFIYYKM